MHAIDEIERVKKEGWFTYVRDRTCTLEHDDVETVTIELHTPSDPDGRVVSSFMVMWVPHFADFSVAPRLEATAGELKMLAVFPELLQPFLAIDHGELSPDQFIAALENLGVKDSD